MTGKEKPDPNEKNWSFGNEGDYAVDRPQRIERIAALLIAGLWVGMIFYSSGFGYALRGAAFFGLGVAAIWWPDAVGNLKSRPSLKSMDWEAMSNPRRPPGVTRLAGWIILVLPVIVSAFRKLVQISA